MMSRARLIPALSCMVCLAMLSACTSAPVTRTYVLSAAAGAGTGAAASAKPVAVAVSDVSLPQYLDRTQIVIRGRGHRVLVIENELWAGNLREDMLRVLVENLVVLLASENVVGAAHVQRIAPEYRVAVEVLRFERDAAGPVVLGARWWLTRAADGMVLASRVETLTGAPLAADAPYEAIVASMSTVYAEFAKTIAQRILAISKSGT